MKEIQTLMCAGDFFAAVDRLRSTAKGLAYDVGSLTWPGWEEPGIDPTPEDLAFGRECARLNLRLAIELKKPALKISMAYWLVGADALAILSIDEEKILELAELSSQLKMNGGEDSKSYLAQQQAIQRLFVNRH